MLTRPMIVGIAVVVVVGLAILFYFDRQESVITDPMTGCQYERYNMFKHVAVWQETEDGFVHAGCRVRTVRPVQGLPSTTR